MRIAYFGHVNGGRESGVFHKIGSQIDQWQAAGHDVRLFIAARDAAEPWQSRFSDVIVRRYGGPVSRIRAMVDLVRSVRAFRPDVVYLRWDMFYPPMLAFPRRAALVVEINTDDLREYALGTRIRAFYNARTRSLVLRRARALVFVTDELSRRPSFSHYRGRHRVITNGIDLDAYPSLPAPANEPPRLVFVGSPGQPWHGIDKVAALAGIRRDWQFDVVGMGPDETEATANVTWHGPLERDDVLRILGRADVAIGTLALHRKSMAEASPLKVREYLAVGLPVLYGYIDPDADRLSDGVLRIANNETNVLDEIDRIDAFVERSRGARVSRSDVGHIDVTAKERERLALFGELVGG